MWCVLTTAAQAQQPVDTNVTLVNGLHVVKIKTSAVCDMCKETLEKAMAYEKGVKNSNLDVDTKVFTVTFDPKKTNLDKLRLAIVKSGYDADGQIADEKAYNNLHACCKKDAKH
ncbi:MAG: copper chaperone [Bacteroidetes bacterium]|nr:MAG: copper chaperone [Bacteroidota bacterium]